MATTVSMPQLGETVTEGTILRWLKQVGDSIGIDEILVEISTDKVDTEVPSPAAGVIQEILVEEGETIAVGTAMVVIADAGEADSAPAGAAPTPAPLPKPRSRAGTTRPKIWSQNQVPVSQPEPEPAPEPTPALQPEPETVEPPVAEPTPAAASGEPAASAANEFLSPVVRKLAREHDIDPSVITGTGREGRVTRNDVLGYIDKLAAGGAPTPSANTPPEVVSAPERHSCSSTSSGASSRSGADVRFGGDCRSAGRRSARARPLAGPHRRQHDQGQADCRPCLDVGRG